MPFEFFSVLQNYNADSNDDPYTAAANKTAEDAFPIKYDYHFNNFNLNLNHNDANTNELLADFNCSPTSNSHSHSHSRTNTRSRSSSRSISASNTTDSAEHIKNKNRTSLISLIPKETKPKPKYNEIPIFYKPPIAPAVVAVAVDKNKEDDDIDISDDDNDNDNANANEGSSGNNSGESDNTANNNNNEKPSPYMLLTEIAKEMYYDHNEECLLSELDLDVLCKNMIRMLNDSGGDNDDDVDQGNNNNNDNKNNNSNRSSDADSIGNMSNQRNKNYMNYKMFLKLRDSLPERAHQFFTASIFRKFQCNANGEIRALNFYHFISIVINMLSHYINLCRYDMSNIHVKQTRRYLTEYGLELFILDQIPSIPSLMKIGEQFHQYYQYHATRKFMFILSSHAVSSSTVQKLHGNNNGLNSFNSNKNAITHPVMNRMSGGSNGEQIDGDGDDDDDDDGDQRRRSSSSSSSASLFSAAVHKHSNLERGQILITDILSSDVFREFNEFRYFDENQNSSANMHSAAGALSADKNGGNTNNADTGAAAAAAAASAAEMKSKMAQNWFSTENALLVYQMYLQLDRDCNGTLSEKEMLQYNRSSLSNLVIKRIFQCKQTWFKDMDYKGFLDFILAMQNKNTVAGLDYWWEILDIDGKGYLTPLDLHALVRSVSKKIGIFVTDSEPIPAADVTSEIIDIVHPKNKFMIYKKELFACGMFSSVIDVLTDVNGFLDYENREALNYQQQQMKTLKEQQQQQQQQQM